MKISRHFLCPNHKSQLPLHYQFGNFRYSFGYFHTSSSSSPSVTLNKRQLLLLYENTTATGYSGATPTLTTTTTTTTATTSIRFLPTSYNSSYRSFCRKFLPVIAAPTFFVCNFRLIDFGQQRRPYNKSVLNYSQSLTPCLLLTLQYHHSQQFITSEYQCLFNNSQKRLHQSFRKMVWPTEHDCPQNADGTEVF